jgi:hypothetical protein
MPSRQPTGSPSVYYYSDTLRRRGIGDAPDSAGRPESALHESDSGVSSRSGHNTSSESTPQPVGGEMGRSFRRGQGPLGRPGALLSSSEDMQQGESPVRHPRQRDIVETQIVVRNTTKREPIVKL